MTSLTILPILNFLLVPNNGTVFHLTSIINSVVTKDVTIVKIENNNQKIDDVLEDTLRLIRKDVAVTVLDTNERHQKLIKERSLAITVFVFDKFVKESYNRLNFDVPHNRYLVLLSTNEKLSKLCNLLMDKDSKFHKRFIKSKIFRFIVIADEQAVMINLFTSSVTQILDHENIFNDYTIDTYGHELNLLYYSNVPLSYIIDNKMYGVDGHVKDIICVKLNATCILHIGEDLEGNRDLRKFYAGGYDIQLNLHSFSKRSDFEQIERSMLYPMEMESVCVVIVKNDVNVFSVDGLQELTQMTHWSSPLLLLYLTFAFVGILWFFLLRKTDNRIGLFDACFNMFQIMLLVPIGRRLTLKVEKFMVCLLFLANIVVFENYKMSFVTQSIRPQYKNEINSLSKLNESNITVHAADGPYDWLRGSYIEDTIFMKRFIRSDYFSYKHVLSGKKIKNIGFLVYKSLIENTGRRMSKQFAMSQFHLIDECLSDSPVSYPVAPTFLLKDEVNRYLMFIREAGLDTYWMLLNEYDLRKHNLAPQLSNGNQVDGSCFGCDPVFSFRKLSLVFRLVVIDYAAAFLVFVSEVSRPSLKRFGNTVSKWWEKCKLHRK